jgi:DNA-binding transcriptional LysR family regulator
MDRIDELIVFAAIMDAGSLAAAARRLRRSPPAITRALAALEGRVGTRLFQRTSRQLSPTPAGRRMATQARELLGGYEQALGSAKEDQSLRLQGVLRVTAPTLFGRWHLTPLVLNFLDAHPGVRIELEFTNRRLDMIDEGIDVAVRIGPLAEAGLIARPVGHVSRVLTASPGYIKRRGTPHTPRELVKHDIVYVSHRSSSAEWRFRSGGRELVVRLAPRLIASEVEGALDAVRAGGGITRTLSYQVADDLSLGALVRVLPKYELPPWPVHLVVPTARHMPRLVRAFLDAVTPALDALPVIHE